MNRSHKPANNSLPRDRVSESVLHSTVIQTAWGGGGGTLHSSRIPPALVPRLQTASMLPYCCRLHHQGSDLTRASWEHPIH